MGEGRPVVLIHGLFSDGLTNWIKFGAAEKVAAEGCRVIMPDLRAHGLSAKPQDVESYPRGILARDIKELIEQLELTDYVLGGFSLGARTTVQVVGEGASPVKAILAGMGFEGLSDWNRRQAFFHEAIAQFDIARRGDPWWMAIQFMKTMNVDRVAAGHLLRTFEDAHPDWLQSFTMPTMVLCGTEDSDNGSAPALAEALPNAEYAPIPGTHMSSVTQREFGERLAAFVRGA
ncbi:alpha/beta hydrolase [Sphingomonas sp. HDW15A]|nr:alpha/beta hydrolase [Sphingomonas sp. HDW15A]